MWDFNAKCYYILFYNAPCLKFILLKGGGRVTMAMKNLPFVLGAQSVSALATGT